MKPLYRTFLIARRVDGSFGVFDWDEGWFLVSRHPTEEDAKANVDARWGMGAHPRSLDGYTRHQLYRQIEAAELAAGKRFPRE